MSLAELRLKLNEIKIFSGNKAIYRPDLHETQSGDIQIPTLNSSQKDLTKQDLHTLRKLTDEANLLLANKAESLQKEYEEFSASTANESELKLKEQNLKLELRECLHQVFKDKFDFSKYEKLRDSDPVKKKFAFLSHPIFRVAVKDSQTVDFTRTRDVFDKTDSNFLFGLFQIKSLPSLKVPKIGWMSFEKMFMESHLLQNSKSRVSRKTDSSKELKSLSLVGFFPEYFVGKNNPNSFTVYTVDRFKQRFKDVTANLLKPFREGLGGLMGSVEKASRSVSSKLSGMFNFNEIKRFVSENSFESLKDINDAAIMKASGRWLSKHEDFHRDGRIPRVNTDAEDPSLSRTKPRTIKDIGFFLKDKFETGAWEEMRVDILALLDFSNKGKDSLSGEAVNQIKEFVLAERTLRYATQHDVNDTFDAVVSQVLINWFVDQGAIDREKLYLEHVLDMSNPVKINKALVALKDTMKQIEDEIADEFEIAIANNIGGLKDILNDLELSDNDFKTKLEQTDVFKESRQRISSFMRYWANWHQDLRDLNSPIIIEKGKGDLDRFEQETGINSADRIWKPELSESAKPKRIPEHLRERVDRYNSVHPYVNSLRNMKYALDNELITSLAG